MRHFRFPVSGCLERNLSPPNTNPSLSGCFWLMALRYQLTCQLSQMFLSIRQFRLRSEKKIIPTKNQNSSRKQNEGLNNPIPGASAGDLPDRSASRFWIGFLISSPMFWLVFIGYGSSGLFEATVPALLIGLFIGGISAIGKKTFGFILKFLAGGF